MRIGIVAGEMSGDILGAGLVEALQRYFPEAVFEGIAGPRMQARGVVSLYPMDRLSVMGLVEPLKRLPELLQMRAGLVRHFSENPPAVLIGIDSPDFNLALEERIHSRGIPAVHYVSPSVWAWRQKRVHRIARAVDLVLALFPFEADFYRHHRVPVECVGHPLADALPLEVDVASARRALGYAPDARLIALMPGSRRSEVEKLGELFLDTARFCLGRCPDLKFVLPAANAERYRELERLLASRGGDLPVQLLAGESHAAMAAADVLLMASGTVALEGLLLKKPMVVAYRVAELSYRLLKRLVKVEFISLPNLLAGCELVPEFIQHDATPEALGESLLARLLDPELSAGLQQSFLDIHRNLRRDASEAAASAVARLIRERNAHG